MSDNKQEINETKPKRYPSQVVLTIRVIVGGYVLYLMYQVMGSGDEKSIWMYLVVAILTLIGGAFAVVSLKMLIMGQYEGGKRDPYKDIEEDSEKEDVTEALEDEKASEDDSANQEIEIENVNDIAEVIEE